MRRIRIDFAIAMVIAFAVGAIVEFLGGKVIDSMEAESQEMVYSDTLIGAAPTDKVPVVSSISEMMEEDCFTFYVDDSLLGVDFIYYKGTTYRVYEMMSGEFVLVDEYYMHSDIEYSDAWGSGLEYYKVLPIGRVVHKSLDQKLIDKVKEEGYTLSDTSFYVDMTGKFDVFSRDDAESTLENISFLVGIVVFFVVRYIMIASGVFPPVFPLRFLKTWKHYIVYYGILYYGEEVNRIVEYRKQEKYDQAASEFMRLTHTTMDEARMAMNMWGNIYGEGILLYK